MNKIDEYINSIYRDTDNNSKDIQDLKQEMKSHLMQTVKELQDSGVTNNDSVRIAIERFGEEFQIRKELNQVVTFQKLFARKTLITSLIFLIVSAIFFITSYFVKENFNKQLIVMNSQADFIEHKLVDEGIIGVETYFKELYKNDKTNPFTYISIKKLPKEFDENKRNYTNLTTLGELKYNYPKEIKDEYYKNSIGKVILSKDVKYFLETGVKTSANWDNSKLYFGLGILIFAICWVLWIIWSIINVYRRGRLNSKWCIILVLTSIIGYFIHIILNISPKEKVVSTL